MAFVPANGGLIRPDLDGEIRKYSLLTQGAVALSIFPALVVENTNGQIPITPTAVYSQGISSAKRGYGGSAIRIEGAQEFLSYDLEEYNLELALDETKLRGQTERIRDQAERQAAELTALHVVRAYEQNTCAYLNNDTNFPPSGTTGVTVGTAWTDPAADIIGTILTGLDTGEKASGGIRPNTLTISQDLVRPISLNTAVRATFAGGNAGRNPTRLTAEQMAEIFRVDRVNIAGMLRNNASRGLSPVNRRVWDRQYALLTYTPTNVSPDSFGAEPQFGRTLIHLNQNAPVGGDSLGSQDILGMSVVMYERFEGAHNRLIGAMQTALPLAMNIEASFNIKGVMAAE